MPSKLWDEIIHSLLNFIGGTAWMSNFIPHIIMDVITYPCSVLNHVSLGIVVFNLMLCCIVLWLYTTLLVCTKDEVQPWWRHQMKTFSALLAICAGNSPVPGEFPSQWPVTRSFDVFFDLRLNKRLSKQSWGWWFETLSRPLWRHCNKQIFVLMQSHANIFYEVIHSVFNWIRIQSCVTCYLMSDTESFC